MLLTMPVQMTEIQPMSGDEPVSAGGLPVPATPELVTFADLLKLPAAPDVSLPPVVSGESLPTDGKALPPVADAPTPLADWLKSLRPDDEPTTPDADPVPPSPAAGAPVAMIAIPADPAGEPLPEADSTALSPAPAGAPGTIPAVPTSLPLPEQVAEAAEGSSARDSRAPPNKTDASALAIATQASDTAGDPNTDQRATAAPQPGPVLEAVLAGLGRDAPVMPAADALPAPTVSPAVHAPAPPVLTSPHGAAALAAPQPFLPTTSVDAGVDQPNWADAFSDRVLMIAGNHIQRAEIRLHPAELGPVHVHVSVDDDATTLAFTAQHAVTREAIEHALPRLRELFSHNGLSLGNASVTGDGGGNRDSGGRYSAEPSLPMAGPIHAEDTGHGGAAASRPISLSHQLVDTFV